MSKDCGRTRTRRRRIAASANIGKSTPVKATPRACVEHWRSGLTSCEAMTWGSSVDQMVQSYRRRAIIGGIAGNVMELYDFARDLLSEMHRLHGRNMTVPGMAPSKPAVEKGDSPIL